MAQPGIKRDTGNLSQAPPVNRLKMTSKALFSVVSGDQFLSCVWGFPISRSIWFGNHSAKPDRKQPFKVLTDQGLESIDRRFEGFARTLDGVAGLFLSSDLVTAEDMHAHVEALMLPMASPASVPIGFVKSTGVGALGAAQGLPRKATAFHGAISEPKVTDTTLLGYDFKADPQLLAWLRWQRATPTACF